MFGRVQSFVFLLLLVATTSAQSEVYRWTGEDGRIQFGDKPPSSIAPERMDLRINTYSAPPVVSRSGPANSSRLVSGQTVVMYSASWCGVCKQARNYFHTKGIAFAEYDVETSSKGRRDFRRLGGLGVPIILDGERRMNGFSIAQFEALFGR